MVWFVYSVTSEAAHPLVTRIVVGCCALIATVCAGAFLRYTWTTRSQLQDSGILAFIALICLLALSASVLSWKAFWNCLLSKTCGTEDPD